MRIRKSIVVLLILVILLGMSFAINMETIKYSNKERKEKNLATNCVNDGERGTYRIFFGNLHAHTSISDGEGRPADAFAYARDVAGLDFMAVTDHGEQIMPSEWDEIVNSANQFNRDGEFVAIYGFEFADVLQGHVCVWNSSVNLYNLFLSEFYDWIVLHPEAVAGFNHPGEQAGCFNNFAFVNNETDQRIVGIECFNKDMDSYQVYFPKYIEALDKGWHIGPTAGQDNHDANWGTKNGLRTAVLANNLTRGEILDALSKRRCYATNDNNLQLHFFGNGLEMGSIVVGTSLNLNLTINDPDAESIRNATIFTNNGVVVHHESLSGSRPFVNITIEPITTPRYYFARVYEADGDVAFTAPIWIYPTYNFMPVANAGLDINVTTFTEVTLNGSASYDEEDCPYGDVTGTILTYNWTILSYPAGLGSAPVLYNATSARPSFIPTKPGSYIVYLKVRDSNGVWSAYDTVTVYVENNKPVAEAGENKTVKFLDKVELDGSGSRDIEDCPLGDSSAVLQYEWLVVQDPTGTVALDDPHKQKPTFTAPTIEGDYKFSLRVRDSYGASSEPDVVTITVQWKDLPPKLAQDAPTEVYLTEDIPDDTMSLYDIFIDDSQLYYDCPTNEETANITIEFLEGGKIRITPYENWFGNQTVCISACDGVNAPVWWNFTVKVLPANDVPKIISIGEKMPSQGFVSGFDVKCGEWLNLTMEVVDADIARGESQSLIVECNLSSILVSGEVRLGEGIQRYNLSYHPDRTSEGLHAVSVMVRDSDGGIDTVSFVINVVFVNSAPMLEDGNSKPIANPTNGTKMYAGESVYLNASKFVDIDGDRLIYTWSSDVEGKTLYSGFLSSIKIILSKVGVHTITLKVEDGHGGIVTSSVKVNVEKREENNGNTDNTDDGDGIIPGLDDDVAIGSNSGIILLLLLLVVCACAIVGLGIYLRIRRKDEGLEKRFDKGIDEGLGKKKTEVGDKEEKEDDKKETKQENKENDIEDKKENENVEDRINEEKNGEVEDNEKEKGVEDKDDKGKNAKDKDGEKDDKNAGNSDGDEINKDKGDGVEERKLDSKQAELEARETDVEMKK
ncbi:MAG: CehA/McbA family metallohydrolase [Thermoplasmata archaeon]